MSEWLALAPDRWFCFVLGKNTWRNMESDSLIIQRISVDFPVGKFLPFLCCRLFYRRSKKGKTEYGREARPVALSPAAHAPEPQPPRSVWVATARPKNEHSKFPHFLFSVTF